MTQADDTQEETLGEALQARQASRRNRPRPWLDNSVLSLGWDNFSQDIPEPVTPPTREPLIPRYFETVPFRTQFYFFRWLQRTLEQCCFDYAQRDLPEINDPVWRYQNLRQHLYDKDRPWKKPGMIELTDWTDLFDQTYLPGVDLLSPEWRVFLRSVEAFRHLIVHRQPVDVDTVHSIMKLPCMLGDENTSRTVERVYRIILADSAQSVSQEDLQDAKGLIYKSRELRCAADLLGRIQDSLELSFWIDRGVWNVPERVELQEYQENWSFERGDGLNRSILLQMRNLRNAATHRADLDKWETMGFVKDAIICTNILGNLGQALEIEILAETWFTSKPRTEVLKRLKETAFDNSYTSADLETEHGMQVATRERKRRFAVARTLIQSESDGVTPLPPRSELRFVRRRRRGASSIVLERHTPTRPLILNNNPSDEFEVLDTDDLDAAEFPIGTVVVSDESLADREELGWVEEHTRMVCKSMHSVFSLDQYDSKWDDGFAW